MTHEKAHFYLFIYLFFYEPLELGVPEFEKSGLNMSLCTQNGAGGVYLGPIPIYSEISIDYDIDLKYQ